MSQDRQEVQAAPGAGERPAWLYASVAVVATCGIVYELLIGAASSQLLGDAITQYSLTIGLYLSAMGLGSWLSQHLEARLFAWFLGTELGVGALGGFSVLLLFSAYAEAPDAYPFVQYGLTLALGTLVGLEVPVLLRLLADRAELRYHAAYVLSLDYLGGLVGSVAFPLLLLPWLGLVRTALLMGLLNVGVAWVGAWRYQPGFVARRPWFGLASALLVLALGACVARSQSLEAMLEESLYRDPVVFSEQSPYQRIVLTRSGAELRLYLNGNLQYSSTDEHRYHEALVQVPIAMMGAAPRHALILGGGDGLAARELLKHPGLGRIDLVDLDAKMTELHRRHPLLVELNGGSLQDPKVRLHHQDALKYLEGLPHQVDLIVVDLPDPSAEALAKLYSREFFRLAGQRLRRHGALVVQASSPYFAREAFWCVARTVEAAGLQVRPYHLDVPSFGDWGFVLASPRALRARPRSLGVPTRHLNGEVALAAFAFGKDADGSASGALVPSTVARPSLLGYYQRGWAAER